VFATILGIALVIASSQAVTVIARGRVVDALRPLTQDFANYSAYILDSAADADTKMSLLAEYAEEMEIAAIVVTRDTQSFPFFVVGTLTGEEPAVPILTNLGDLLDVHYTSADRSVSIVTSLVSETKYSNGKVTIYRDVSSFMHRQISDFQNATRALVSGLVALFVFALTVVFVGIDRRIKSDGKKLVAQNLELLDANVTKDHVLATASHELKTPLTAVIAFTDVLKKRLADRMNSKEIEYFKVVSRNEERLKHLINDLVDLKAVESGRIGLTLEDFDLVTFLQEILKNIQGENILPGREFSYKLPPIAMNVNADSLRVSQVISNLLVNAHKYSPDGTEVDLVVTQCADNVKICVSDHGMGVSEEDSERIFEPFVRSDRLEIRQKTGLGIGLALCRRIVELHGGVIGVKSRHEGGSHFWFTLPLIDRTHERN